MSDGGVRPKFTDSNSKERSTNSNNSLVGKISNQTDIELNNDNLRHRYLQTTMQFFITNLSCLKSLSKLGLLYLMSSWFLIRLDCWFQCMFSVCFAFPLWLKV